MAPPAPSLPDGGTLSTLLRDALGRAEPSLPDGEGREEMAAALGRLSLVVETKSVTEVKLAHAEAEAAIASFELVVEDEANAHAELGGIRLALGVIASEVAAVTEG